MGADSQQNSIDHKNKPQCSLYNLTSYASHHQSSLCSTPVLAWDYWKDVACTSTSTTCETATENGRVDDTISAAASSPLTCSSSVMEGNPIEYSPMKISDSGSNPSSPTSSTVLLPPSLLAVPATNLDWNHHVLGSNNPNTEVTHSHTDASIPTNNNSALASPLLYQPINLNYPGLIVLHTHPPLFAIQDFLSPDECHDLIRLAYNMDRSLGLSSGFGPAPVVSKAATDTASSGLSGSIMVSPIAEVSATRTSSTCCISPSQVPGLLLKLSFLLPTMANVEHNMEAPQVGRYETGQHYMQHYDAFDLTTEAGQAHASNGGQRIVTILIYLNTVPRGGCTYFPRIRHLRVQPRQGMALIFHPATLLGELDPMALHAAEPAMETTKYVSQIWIRQGIHHKVLPHHLTVVGT